MDEVNTMFVCPQEHAEWTELNFDKNHIICEGVTPVLVMQKNKRYGPFYVVQNTENLNIRSIPKDEKEACHWMGLAKPSCPNNAKEMYALPEGNKGIYLFELFIKPTSDDCKGFIVVSKYTNEKTNDVIIGTTLAINFNNSAVKCLEIRRKYQYNDSKREYIVI